jgi:putative redox protein
MHEGGVSPFDRSVRAEHLDNFQVLIRTDDHAVLIDEPTGIGDNLGPNPFDSLLASLCGCTIITVWDMAARGKMALEKMWADASIKREGSGKDATFDITLTLKVRGDLAEKDLKRLEKYAERCPIHGLLSKAATITTEIVIV